MAIVGARLHQHIMVMGPSEADDIFLFQRLITKKIITWLWEMLD